ncbi:MAG: hypothetical protein ACFFDC_14480 [Promethearchaeota archaeon]
MINNNGLSVMLDIMANMSIFGHVPVSIVIIIFVLVLYSRTRHQGLIFIILAETLNLGWLTFNVLSMMFLFPVGSDLVAFTQLLNIVSLFIHVISGFLLIVGIYNLVQDLSVQPHSKGKPIG